MHAPLGVEGAAQANGALTARIMPAWERGGVLVLRSGLDIRVAGKFFIYFSFSGNKSIITSSATNHPPTQCHQQPAGVTNSILGVHSHSIPAFGPAGPANPNGVKI